MQKKTPSQSAFFNPRVLIALLFCIAATCSILNVPLLGFFQPETPPNVPDRTLTFAERVAYQRAIEEVHWRHRIWPKENLKPKPSLDEVMSAQQIENKVEDYLRDSQALEDYWQRAITPQQLQAETERMARDTKQPEVLRELFEALGNDPFVIAECLAKPVLTERLIAELSAHANDQRFAFLRTQAAGSKFGIITLGNAAYTVPEIDPCTDDTWTATTINNAPSGRVRHTAIWTGSEMIVWGGFSAPNQVNTGGRYDPATDSWTFTNTNNAPNGRYLHTAVWTGSEMIVWGGTGGTSGFNTGGRYDPGTDSWTATSITKAPSGRRWHTAVWTGTEMIVWAGYDGNNDVNTGGRYDPSTDTWTGTTTSNVPPAREQHTTVWTGNEMIVWGGYDGAAPFLNTGGRYDPGTNSWIATSTTNAAAAREQHTAVWSGNEMIVWGGDASVPTFLNTGGRYNPSTNSWTATTTTNAPVARHSHTAVWTGSEMIVWGGIPANSGTNTGGRYCAQTPTPTPTPTPTSTPCSGRCTPTPRPRPTPPPRP